MPPLVVYNGTAAFGLHQKQVDWNDLRANRLVFLYQALAFCFKKGFACGLHQYSIVPNVFKC